MNEKLVLLELGDVIEEIKTGLGPGQPDPVVPPFSGG
jgi:hypothetical protein